MSQTLRTQLASIASMDIHRWQYSLDQLLQFHLSSAKRSRNRGVFLSRQGWQKLIQAGVLYNELGERYTYEWLSDRSLLDERTVSRLLSCEVKVDKNTLETFFNAFNLLLEAGDYTLSQENGVNEVKANATLIVQRVELEQLVEELYQIKQRLEAYDRLFHQLKMNEINLSQRLGT
jgi:hypothetical protein